MSVKKRTWAGSYKWEKYYSSPVTSGTYTLPASFESIDSGGHPFQLLGRSDQDIGGAMFLSRDRREFQVEMVALDNHINAWYNGPVGPNIANPSRILMPIRSTTSQLYAKGTTALARSIPTNPSAGLATFLGELHEGVPKFVGSALFRSRARDFRKSGDEYLNVEFGWKPFVSDIRKFARAVTDSERILNAYHKDADRLIKRRYEFPKVEYNGPVTTIGSASIWTQASTNLVPGGYSSPSTEQISSFEKMWFEGAFTYHIPTGSSFQDRIGSWTSDANKLLGARLTPETLWQLAPWSWAIDWFGNVGDIIHNISAFSNDSLVMKYGYLMEHKSITGNWLQGPVTLRYASGDRARWFSSSRTMETKSRVPATPYGFGLNPTSFTERQWAIVAALGLTKSPRVL